MFRTVSPSIIRSLRLYIQHQVFVKQVLWLLASGNEMELYAQYSYLKFILFWNNTLHVSVSPSIVRSLKLYIQHQVFVI